MSFASEGHGDAYEKNKDYYPEKLEYDKMEIQVLEYFYLKHFQIKHYCVLQVGANWSCELVKWL